MKRLRFKDEMIWQDNEVIGFYSFRDENSVFCPTKKKLFWASICEHESQSDDFVWWSDDFSMLKKRIKKYLENKEKGIKDLPQISEQINRIVDEIKESATRIFGSSGYWNTRCSRFVSDKLSRLDLPREIRKRGFWYYGKQLVPRDIYENF